MELTELTATAAAKLISDREISSEELTRSCLERIAARDSTVHAFVHCNPEFSLAQARQADRSPSNSPLHGVPFAVKDVIDTQDFPTECGTAVHRGRQPDQDANCVRLMREAGAVLLGKVVSTEYAMFTANETRHPLNPAHTPGGSSSGTAAAVADHMVPIAFGNQTAGSLIRPAAFCGVYGLKPTHGTTDSRGILPLQPYFDTLGYMARDIADLKSFYSIVSEADQGMVWPLDRPPRIGICETGQWSFAEAETRALLPRVAHEFAANGAQIEDFVLPEALTDLVGLHRRILYRGIADSLAVDFERAPEKMSTGLHDVINEGRALNDADYINARNIAEDLRTNVNKCFGDFDAIIAPSTPGVAPVGEGTGSPIFQVTWTLLGVPCLNLPVAVGPKKLPLGVQLIGRTHADREVLAIGEYLMRNFETLHVQG